MGCSTSVPSNTEPNIDNQFPVNYCKRPKSMSAVSGLPKLLCPQIAHDDQQDLLNKPRYRHSWPNVKSLPYPALPSMCDSAKDMVPLPVHLHEQCFSYCESNNTSALRYLSMDFPNYSFDFKKSYAIDVGITDPLTTEINPLQLVCILGNLEIVYLLLLKDMIDVNAVDGRYKMSALHFAIMLKNTEISELLCRHCKLDVNQQDYRLNTPMHLAVQLLDTSTIKYMLQYRKDLDIYLVNYLGNTIFHEACITGSLCIIAQLFDYLLQGYDQWFHLPEFDLSANAASQQEVKISRYGNIFAYNCKFSAKVLKKLLQVKITYVLD